MKANGSGTANARSQLLNTVNFAYYKNMIINFSKKCKAGPTGSAFTTLLKSHN